MVEDVLGVVGSGVGSQVSKPEARYRKAEGGQVCARCISFVEPESCQLVKGTIGPAATCDLWQGQEQNGLMAGDEMAGGGPSDIMAALSGGLS